MQDSTVRSLAKAVSYRIAGTVVTFVICWIMTGHVLLAGSIAFAEVFAKLFLFWAHERIWNYVRWGQGH